MDNTKKLLQDIVGLEGYDQLQKALSKYEYADTCMSIVVVPRTILSWVSQSANAIKKGESRQLPLPGKSDFKVKFTRHSDEFCNIEIQDDKGKPLYQFFEEPIISFEQTRKSEKRDDRKDIPNIVSGLMGIHGIVSEADQSHVQAMSDHADFHSITQAVGKLADALVAKRMVYANAYDVIDNLGKIEEKKVEGEKVQVKDNKRVDKVMEEQDKNNLTQAPTKEQMADTSNYKVPHIKAKKLPNPQDAVVEKESPFKKEEMLSKPKRGLRSLLMKPVHAAIAGAAMAGKAAGITDAGQHPNQLQHNPTQHAFKMHTGEMQQIADKSKNPLPQPKPIAQAVQVVQQPPVKKA